MKNLYILIIILLSALSVQAQVGIGTDTPDPSSILDIESTDGGILIPRMEESDRTAIASPVQGLLVYQTNNEDGFYCFNGTIWIRLISSSEFISESGVVHNTTDIARDDFVFGSTQLNNMSGASDDYRMFFDKGKGAFRVGYNDNSDWDNTNLGSFSMAMGRDNLATSSYAIALGYDNVVSGTAATALGYINNSTGDYSVAMGRGTTASGNHSVSAGIASKATGLNSISIGNTSDAIAENAIALGRLNDATAINAAAIGFSNVASGENSFSLGNNNSSTGLGSFTLGNNLSSPSGSEIVVGTYNERYTPVNGAGFDAADRLFSVGNGSRVSGTTTFSNAFTILKNSNTGINTSSPQSSLDVRAVNHLGAVTATDGVLVPRVIDLTINGSENGQLVFLNADWVNTLGTPATTDDISYKEGFHYWNSTASVWSPVNTDESEWTYDPVNTRTTANRPADAGNDVVVTDTGAIYANTDQPMIANGDVYTNDKLFVNGATTINEGALRVVRTNVNSSTNTFTMIDLSKLAGYGPKFTYRMAVENFAGTREMGAIVARLVDNDDATRSSKMDFVTYNLVGPRGGFQSGLMINNRGYLALFKENSQDIDNDDATNKVHIKDVDNDPLRIEGLQASTSSTDRTLMITDTGIVKLANTGADLNKTSSFEETTSGASYTATLADYTIRIANGTTSVDLPAPAATNKGKIYILIAKNDIVGSVSILSGGSALNITDDTISGANTFNTLTASDRYTIQSTGTEYIVISH
ncbi:hypothetical protein [Nonlabens ulvanivorans]|uniref:hypothetical protein n=1 Tax=Nonlabens ulvanivorans TaxID=906888 RepID=UPI0037C6F7C9